MSNSTVYDIRLQYTMADKVSKPARKLDAQLARTTKKSDKLDRTFKRMLRGAGAYFGFRAGVKHLIGFNSTMEQAKIQMSGMIQLSTKLDHAASNSAAAKMVDTLQQKAKASVGTTADMVEMASMITRPVLAAGMGMEQLANFTAQSVVASKAFGIEAGMAARDIESALMGQLRSVDRFSRALLEPLGFVGEKGREAFNELGAAARAAKLEEALGASAIADMAGAQAKSFGGVLSTFQDTIQMALGKAGMPLFQAITAELSTWNDWISNNGDKLDSMAKGFGDGLKSGFGMVKSVIGFMVDHADLLITVAKMWAGIKIGQKLSGMAETMGQMAGQASRRAGGMAMMANFDKVGMSAAKFGVKITSAASKFATFLPAIGMATMALSGLWDWWNSADKERAAKKAKERAEGESKLASKMTDLDMRGLTREGGGYSGGTVGHLESLRKKRIAAGGDKPSNEEKAAYQALMQELPEIRSKLQSVAMHGVKTGLIGEAGQMQKQNFKSSLESEGYFKGIENFEPLIKLFLEKQSSETLEDAMFSITNAVNDGVDIDHDSNKILSNILDATWVPAALTEYLNDLQAGSKDDKGKNIAKGKISVTIQRIEVQSDDPDRFVVGLSETVRDAVRNRSAAFDALPEGR